MVFAAGEEEWPGEASVVLKRRKREGKLDVELHVKTGRVRRGRPNEGGMNLRCSGTKEHYRFVYSIVGRGLRLIHVADPFRGRSSLPRIGRAEFYLFLEFS